MNLRFPPHHPTGAFESEMIKIIEVSDRTRYVVICFLGFLLLFSSLIFNTPREIIGGLQKILVSPSILITDYFELANIGAAFFNSGALLLVGIFISRKNQVKISGPILAALLTLAGFSFFGKNLYNSWAVPLGVYIYSIYQKEKYSKFILLSFFGTALGPLTSQISFGLGLPLLQGIFFGNLAGVIAGFILPPLANHFVKFHQGFNLYNTGFTAGIIGMFFMGVLRAFGFESETSMIIASGYNNSLSIYLYLLFLLILLLGCYFNHWKFTGLGLLFKNSGKLVSDFVHIAGFGVTLINMALLGILATSYVLFVGGELNGPILGGIFTIVGFGAFGKHLKNTLPIFAGVYLASTLQIFDTHSTNALLAALFGTTLAPIAGYYGWFFGVLAGFLHMSMVMNIGYLHGGMNLYNNGFSGGFIAAVLVPIIDAIKKDE